MPVFNLSLTSTAQFTANFTTSSGAITIPSSATLTITYPPSSNSIALVSCAIGMTQNGSFFVGTWAVGVAAAGLASASVTAPGQSSALGVTLRLH